MELSKLVSENFEGVKLFEEEQDGSVTSEFLNSAWLNELMSAEVKVAIAYYNITGKEVNFSKGSKCLKLVQGVTEPIMGETSVTGKLIYLTKVLEPLMVRTAKHGDVKTNQTFSVLHQLEKAHSLQKQSSAYFYKNALTNKGKALIKLIGKQSEPVSLVLGDSKMRFCIENLTPNLTRAFLLKNMVHLRNPVEFEARSFKPLKDYLETHRTILNVIEIRKVFSNVERELAEAVKIDSLDRGHIENLLQEVYGDVWSNDVSKVSRFKLLQLLDYSVFSLDLDMLGKVADIYKTIREEDAKSFYSR